MWNRMVWAGAMVLASFLASAAEEPSPAALRDRVQKTERAFAQSMADRDHSAFVSFLSEEAVFLSRETALRGKQQVAEGWRHYFQGEQAPFSWEPERVEVLDSGGLAISTGPVRDPQGNRVGTFISTWRREPDGSWKVVLDTGCPPCDCK